MAGVRQRHLISAPEGRQEGATVNRDGDIITRYCKTYIKGRVTIFKLRSVATINTRLCCDDNFYGVHQLITGLIFKARCCVKRNIEFWVILELVHMCSLPKVRADLKLALGLST